MDTVVKLNSKSRPENLEVDTSAPNIDLREEGKHKIEDFNHIHDLIYQQT